MSWFNRSNHPTDEELSASLDGMLTGGRLTTLHRHLDGCTACRERLDGLAAVKAALASLPRPVAPRSFALTARHAAVSQTRPAPRSPFVFAPAVALTLLVALLAVDYGALSTSTSRDESLTAASSAEMANASADAATKDGASRSAAPQVAPAPTGGEAGGVTSGVDAASPALTPAIAPFSVDTALAPVPADTDDGAAREEDQPASASESRSAARGVVRLLEIGAAAALVISLLLLLHRQRQGKERP